MVKNALPFISLLPILWLMLDASADSKSSSYPFTRTENIQDMIFGTLVRDPFRWLEDAKSSEVQSWMDAQDQFARNKLQTLPNRKALTQRFRQLFFIDSVSVPVLRSGKLFYTRTLPNKDKAILYVKNGESESTLIDPNVWQFGSKSSLGSWSPSPDGNLLAFSVHPNNADEATIYLIDVKTGGLLEKDRIEGAKYAEPQWTPESDGFYYTYLPTDPSIPIDERPGYAEIRYHSLGTDPKKDPLVHSKTGDPATFIDTVLSQDGRWLFVMIYHGWSETEIYYRDLQKNKTNFTLFLKKENVLASIFAWRESFYILTNDGAPKWQLFKTPTSDPSPAHWKSIVSESKNAVIESFKIVGNHLVLSYLKDASHQIEVRTLDGDFVRTLPFPGIGSSSGVSGEPESDDAFFSFNSYTIPTQIYRTSIHTGETSLWTQVHSPVDPSPYRVDQVWYPSKDGTLISMFIVRRKDMAFNRKTPFLLTGYGGFNVSELPHFTSSIFPWLEAGGGFALANLRGGGEYGEEWHRAGMLTKKQNVFDDFIAAADYLIRENYTQPRKLAISGGSNGGLLMGAALTQRPDLFRAVICAVPLLDMIRYPLFGSGRTWIPEYGSSENEEQFRAIFAYSPYHHVEPGASYPSILFLSSDHDDRVDPLHARKMAAALQVANPTGNPVLLRIEKNAGHGGSDSMTNRVEQMVDSYSFLMDQLAVNPD